jgi:hypothetical protein
MVRLMSKRACLPGYQKFTFSTVNFGWAAVRFAVAAADDARLVKMSVKSRDTGRGLRSGRGGRPASGRQGCFTARM